MTTVLQWTDWLTLAGIFVLGAMSPGPSLAVVVRHSVFGGRRDGMAAALAHGLGIGVYAGFSVVGIAALMLAWPAAVSLLQLVGAGFLLYLATQAARSALASERAAAFPDAGRTARAWRDGFLIAFLNPKVALFFIALFSQFIEPGHGAITKGLIALMAMGIDTVWYLLVAVALSTTVARERFLGLRPWIEGVFAVLLAALAIRMIWQWVAAAVF